MTSKHDLNFEIVLIWKDTKLQFSRGPFQRRVDILLIKNLLNNLIILEDEFTLKSELPSLITVRAQRK